VGAELADVVKNMVWLTDVSDFPNFNSAYARHFPNSPPARATVCSALMVAGALIEIEAVAYKPE
jgi:2-iminobutanoate/2-iminopropanoate deaminase